jgi:hypothetical protein
MQRNLDPVFLQARSTVEELLDAAGYQLAAESHYPDAFGSAEAEYRGRHGRIRLVWDGKDRWLGLSVAHTAASNQHPQPSEWRPLEPERSSAPAQFLGPGALAKARIAELKEALGRHLDEAV